MEIKKKTKKRNPGRDRSHTGTAESSENITAKLSKFYEFFSGSRLHSRVYQYLPNDASRYDRNRKSCLSKKFPQQNTPGTYSIHSKFHNIG